MSLNCIEIKNLFIEDRKKINENHIEDYEYCRLLYENAKRRKSIEGRGQNKLRRSEAKFVDIHGFLSEMEIEGAFDNDAYISDSDYSEIWCDAGSRGSSSFRRSSSVSDEELMEARRKKRVHSSHNSDYSFWSLNSTLQSPVSNTSTYESNYSHLIRMQSRYFYMY